MTPGSNGEGGPDFGGGRNESKFRAVAARGNYLAQDRMGIQFAAKEVSRFTSRPEDQDLRAAKRLARCLEDQRRVVLEYKYQQLPSKVVVW